MHPLERMVGKMNKSPNMSSENAQIGLEHLISGVVIGAPQVSIPSDPPTANPLAKCKHRLFVVVCACVVCSGADRMRLLDSKYLAFLAFPTVRLIFLH